MLRTLLLASGFLIVAIHVRAQNLTPNWQDVDYAGDGQVYHLLDIYLPDVDQAYYPAVIAIYGSAWLANDLKQSAFTTLGQPLLDAGFAVITPNHRSSMDAKFPAQIHDIKAVIRFLRANAEQYRIDTSFIAITGFSSGGYLAALAGTSTGIHSFQIGNIVYDLEGKVGPYTNYSSSVDAVVDWFGPTDFLVMDSCGSSMNHNADNSPESNLIGGPIQNNREKCALANPITYVDAHDPPFLILHGDSDPLVPPCQSVLLSQALQDSGVDCQFILVPGGQHGPGLFEESYFDVMKSFLLEKKNEVNDIDPAGNRLPQFSLAQNYPNPFNAVTSMKFRLQKPAFVSLLIYDLNGSIGRNSDTSSSGCWSPCLRMACKESCQWDILLYMRVEGQTSTRKIVLIK